jgi:pimeloyl-ACP methyl ester carboxylesterase
MLRLPVLLFLLLCAAAPALAASPPELQQRPHPAFVSPTLDPALPETYLALAPRPGVTLPVVLLAPESPKAAVILFAGGPGNIGVSDQGGLAVIRREGNFLVRSRRLFAGHGLVVAVPDAPSDRSGQPEGMSPRFRFSDEHLADIRALAAHLRERYGFKPWLAGTSMGTLSAAWAAARLGDDIGGLILTSTVTRTGKRWDIASSQSRAVLDAGLGRIKVPTLVVAHGSDTCWITPPGDVPRIMELLEAAPRKEAMFFEGGLPMKSDVCEAMSPHGYYGLAEQVVQAIAGFMLTAQ